MKARLLALLDALAARAAGRSLRSGIPLLLLVFTLLAAGGVFQHSLRQSDRAAEADAVDDMTLRANYLQMTLESFYRQGLQDSAQAELAALGAEPGHRLAAVIDERGRVIATSRGLLLDETAVTALPRLSRTSALLAEAAAVRARQAGVARLATDGGSVAALFPVDLGLRGGGLRAAHVGLLFIEYDLTEHTAAAQAGVRSAAWQIVAFLLVLTLLLWLLLYAMLTRRARRIVAAARRIAGGDLAARTGIAGADEIGRIGLAFDDMVARLDATGRQLQAALEAAQMYTWSFDASTQVLVFRRPANRAAAARAGESMPQAAFLERLHPDDRAPFEAALRATLESGAPMRVEYRVADRTGGWRWLTARGNREGLDDAGRALKLTGLAWDVTEAKEAQLALARHRDELEERVAERTEELSRANQELEAFSYSASHDLQAPLRSMRGFSEIVLEEYGERLDAEGRSHLQRIVRAARRMSRMIEDLLAFARSARGELQCGPVDLSGLAEEIAAELRARDPARRSNWRIAGNVVAQGDASLLHSVLSNLLGNAWKYSAERAVAEIGFELREVAGEAVYRVHDNGIGFDMAHAGKIFEPFQRLHSQERFEGSGIGLSTAARIIQRHGGRLWAEAVPDGGAAFCFTVPPRQPGAA